MGLLSLNDWSIFELMEFWNAHELLKYWIINLVRLFIDFCDIGFPMRMF